MKKTAIVYSLLLALILPLCSVQITAADYGTVTYGERLRVSQVVDGDSFIAMKANGQPALIKLIGVDPVDYDASMLYLSNLIMGKEVRVEPEWQSGGNEMWTPCYVYLDSEFVNRLMLETGNAKLKDDHNNADLYGELERQAERAEDREIGIWGRPESTVSSSFTDSVYSSGHGININTASGSDLREWLGVSSSVASRIVNYREDNPFDEVREIKYVSGFTQEIYEDKYDEMTVYTNILTASEEEMLTLGLSQSEIDDIIEFEDDEGFEQISQLRTEDLISRSEYNRIEPFVSLEVIDKFYAAEPEEEVVNVNTAGYSELRDAGVPSGLANDIVNSRKNGYSWKSLGEMAEAADMSAEELDRWADNLTCLTDVNSAYESELRSLGITSGSAIDAVIDNRPYSDVSKLQSAVSSEAFRYLYADETENEYVNINTASEDELSDIGFSDSEVEDIIDEQGRMRDGEDIPVNFSAYDKEISLYTNINAASEKELLSLNSDMTSRIASDIIRYRERGLFGDLDEVQDFFSEMDEERLYRDIEDFIVVR